MLKLYTQLLTINDGLIEADFEKFAGPADSLMEKKWSQEAITLQIFWNVPFANRALKVYCTPISDPDRLNFCCSGL
jgi:hypothetical protein